MKIPPKEDPTLVIASPANTATPLVETSATNALPQDDPIPVFESLASTTTSHTNEVHRENTTSLHFSSSSMISTFNLGRTWHRLPLKPTLQPPF